VEVKEVRKWHGNEMRQRGNEALRYEWLRHVTREWCVAEVIETHGFGLSARAGLTPPRGFKS